MKYIENHGPVSQQEFFKVISSFGFEVVSGVMTNQRTGKSWQHQHVISVRCNRSPAALCNHHGNPTMSHIELRNDDSAIPVDWVCREDLTDSRPDLAETIANMSDFEVETVAKMVSGQR
jgi:hypothetical protein